MWCSDNQIAWNLCFRVPRVGRAGTLHRRSTIRHDRLPIQTVKPHPISRDQKALSSSALLTRPQHSSQGRAWAPPCLLIYWLTSRDALSSCRTREIGFVSSDDSPVVISLSDSQHFAQQLRLDPDEGQQVKSEPPQADSPGEMDRQLLMHDKDPSQMTVPGRSIRDTNTTRTPSLLPHMMMYHSSPLLSRPSWVLSRDGKRQPRKSLSKGCSTKTTSDSG